MAFDPNRFENDKMLQLAASAVNKIDLQGPRGTTLCSMDEIDAMACLVVLSDLLLAPGKGPLQRLESLSTTSCSQKHSTKHGDDHNDQ